MERNSLSNNLKYHNIGGRSMKGSKSHDKDSWEYNSSDSSHGADLLSGFAWPPRSYTCSFCKREFRSAQALGGHMNVHRRDRARLRLSSPSDAQQYPLLNLNLNPNPNPSQNPDNPSPSSQLSTPSTRFPPFTSTLPPLVSPPLSSPSSPSSASPNKIRKWVTNTTPSHQLSNGGTDLAKIKSSKTLFGVREFEGLKQESECEVVKEAGIVRLDLEIGLVRDSKEDLDLELRLGRS